MFNKNEEAKELPTKEEINEVLDVLREATKKEENPPQYGRPIKKKAIGRV